MELLELPEQQITGISIKTNNANEMSDTARLGNLWQRFYQDFQPKLPTDAPIYGVYYEYENDINGEYRVLAGSSAKAQHCKTIIKEHIHIAAGKYLCFKSQGIMPQAIIQAWQQVWAYFANEHNTHKRKYLTDYEHYVSDNEVHIFIGIK